MSINYKDINELTEQTTIAGTEKVPVSSTKYVLFNKIKDWIVNSLKATGLDLGGKQIKNAAIDVVTSLPAATYNFTGRQVTYQGRSYIWDGSAWKCDANTLGGYYASSFVTTNERQSIEGVKIFGSDYIVLNNEPLSNYAMGLRIPVRSALVHSFAINFLFNADLKSNITINAPNTNTYSGNPASLFNGDIYSTNNFQLLVNNISPSNPFVLEVSSNSVLLPFIERASKFIFTESTGWTGNYRTGNSAFLNWKLEIQGSTDGLWYPLINRSGVEDKVNNLTVVGFPSNSLFSTNGNRQGLAFRLTVYEASPYSSPSYPYIFLSQILYFNSQSSAGGNLITERGGTILGDLIVNKTVRSNESINFNTNNIEPTQTGTVTKTSTWLWQYLTQSVNFLWLKLKELFPTTQATTHNYIPKIDNANKKLVKSNINDDGTTPKYGTDTIWHSGNDGSSSGLDADTLDGKHAGNTSGEIPINNGNLNTNLFAEKSNKLANSVTITDFTTFNPTTLGLAVGESCNFIASAATGRPTFEVSTICTGEIQHVYSGHYIYIAYSGANTSLYPLQWAIGGYNSGFKGWQLRNAQGLLDLIKTVDGTNSGLDADLLDGKHASDFAQLVNGKILEGNLPDYIFGQVLFGGFIAISISTNQLVCTLSAKFKSKYNITENFLVLENMPASTYEGVYFMATNSWGTPPNDAQVGDWIISNGFTWEKVDNTDAVSSVNGQTGAVVLTHTEVGAASSIHTHNYESLTNIPENLSMGGFVLSEVNFENITETCIYPLLYGYKYYSVPNKICGTDGVTEDLEGFLFVYKKHDIVSQQLHDTINNSLYIRSFDRNSDEWNQWEKIITCKASSGEQGRSPEVTDTGFDLDKQETPVNTFYNIDTSTYSKDLTINIPLDTIDTYLRNNGPGAGEFKITLMFSSPIDNPALVFSIPSPSVVGTTYTVNGTDPSGHQNISGLEILIKWYAIVGGFLFSVYKVNIL